MSTALREQPVDEVAGTAAGQLRQTGPHQGNVVLLESSECGAQAIDGVSVDETSAEVSATPAGFRRIPSVVRESSAEDSRAFVAVRPNIPRGLPNGIQAGADADPPTVVQQKIKFLDVVRRCPPCQGMSTAGVITDHAADRAPAVRRGIGAEGQTVASRCRAQVIEHDAGLDPGDPPIRVDLNESAEIARRIDDETATGRLAGDAGASAAQRDGRTALASGGDGRGNLLAGARDDDPDGYVPVVGRVGGIKRSCARVERDNAGDGLTQPLLQRPEIHTHARHSPRNVPSTARLSSVARREIEGVGSTSGSVRPVGQNGSPNTDRQDQA